MQVRRLGDELGLIYTEDHGRPILTKGQRSVLFCLTNNRSWQGQLTHQKHSTYNEEVYTFQWSTPSIFDYNEFRRLAQMAFGSSAIATKFYPELALRQSVTDILVKNRQVKLDGALQIIGESEPFYIWVIDKGSGPYHYCVNPCHDALFFQPVKILVLETGKPLRW